MFLIPWFPPSPCPCAHVLLFTDLCQTNVLLADLMATCSLEAHHLIECEMIYKPSTFHTFCTLCDHEELPLYVFWESIPQDVNLRLFLISCSRSEISWNKSICPFPRSPALRVTGSLLEHFWFQIYGWKLWKCSVSQKQKVVEHWVWTKDSVSRKCFKGHFRPFGVARDTLFFFFRVTVGARFGCTVEVTARPPVAIRQRPSTLWMSCQFITSLPFKGKTIWNEYE